MPILCLVTSASERGYGAALMAGVEVVPEADVLVFMDGDASDVADGLVEMVRMVREEDAQLVLGVRDGDVEPSSLLWHPAPWQPAGHLDDLAYEPSPAARPSVLEGY